MDRALTSEREASRAARERSVSLQLELDVVREALAREQEATERARREAVAAREQAASSGDATERAEAAERQLAEALSAERAALARATTAESRLAEALAKEKEAVERALQAERLAEEVAAAAAEAPKVDEAEAEENRKWRQHLEQQLEQVRGAVWPTGVWQGWWQQGRAASMALGSQQQVLRWGHPCLAGHALRRPAVTSSTGWGLG